MRFRRDPNSVDQYIKEEGFYYKEKRRREKEIWGQGRPKTVKYDRSKRNRRIVYMDLLILLIMMGVLIPFAQRMLQKPDDFFGLKVEWDYSYGSDRIFHTLKLTAPEAEVSEDLPPHLLVEVTFTASGGESVIQSDIPPQPGEERFFMGTIPLEKQPDYVGCSIKVGDKEKSFKEYTGKVRYLPSVRK